MTVNICYFLNVVRHASKPRKRHKERQEMGRKKLFQIYVSMKITISKIRQ